MKFLKRAALLGLSLCLLLTGLSACGSEGAGETLSLSVGESLVSLDPIYAENPGDQSILVQLYENLMRVQPDENGMKTAVKGMASSVDQEVQKDGSYLYRFKLRKAKWSDGEPVRAQDFVYAWQRLANPATCSPYASLLSIVAGFEEARISGDMSLLEVTAKNDSTLMVHLTGRYDWFLTEVCTSPATMPLREDVIAKLKEANGAGEEKKPWWSDPSSLVTNGPYVVRTWDREGLSMEPSPRYEGGEKGPETLNFYFADSPEEGWELYKEGTVDLISPLPQEQFSRLAAKEQLELLPELGAYALLFNHQRPELADPALREAMGLVIERNTLAQAAGPAAYPAQGLVPFGVPEPEAESGDFREKGGALLQNEMSSYSERCKKARELMLEVDSGSLGELQYLYIDEGSNAAVAENLCRMWQDLLKISVTPKGLEATDFWMALRSGDYQLAGVELTAPGNDAECFLMQWTSMSQDNLVHYENSAYDTLMSIIATSGSSAARMGCLHDAEALLLSDFVVLPLYQEYSAWFLREGWSGFCRDPRGFFSVSSMQKA